ncbi:FliM/FliN family flagellar motor switch protein [Rhizobiaceae bacterium n13]|uniref:Flagellar motor switch protein FliM n=1 Tax=Ferirhizobium litorale TaxID=2927786 RepID=A0AAE3U3F8_9HYPH|nr:FliM/FliN family flagellar motor switch protein [Fererhizobium litorale]MDI7863390.1 FliM/FliN family flagellar motor switch protein [Fererhizobium litorale]MDI7922333.1 FliM/FliN family flagellar motor switch protein [Fererhizobium litorale]
MTTRTTAPTAQVPAMDRALHAMLTGSLGDKATVAKLAAQFGELYCEFLPDVFKSETGLEIQVRYNGCETGLMNDLIADLGDNMALADGSLRNWSPGFTLACGNGFVITLMENLLGAEPDTIVEPIERPLSKIELDLAVMVFDRIANVLKSGVNARGSFDATLLAPHNADDRPRPDADHVDEYAAAIKLSIQLGPVISEFALIVPQKALLKTTVITPKSRGHSSESQEQWAERIGDQVKRSQITLEARISLQPLTLATIARLAPGDVIPFLDTGEVLVDVSANGKDLYLCEFGRSGANYTVRVKDNPGADGDILRQLIG